MRHFLLLLTLTSYAAYAEEPVQPAYGTGLEIHTSHTSRNVWRASVAALAAADMLDVHSSWGKHELNPVLASSNGTFGAKGALLKLGLQGGLLGLEYLITRGHPKLYRKLSIINFGAAAGVGATAMHNYTIPGRR